MKHTISIAFLAAAGLLTIGNASAQTYGVQAKIPFDFTVGNMQLPAGNYTITASSSNVVVVRNQQLPRIVTLAMVMPDDTQTTKQEHLIFHKYGDQYFLSQIVCPGHALDSNLPTSRREKRAQQQEASIQNVDEVYLALK